MSIATRIATATASAAVAVMLTVALDSQAAVTTAGATSAGQLKALTVPNISKVERGNGANAKLDGYLVQMSRQAATLKGPEGVKSIRATMPRAHVGIAPPRDTPSVLVDIRVTGNSAAARARLESLGLTRGSNFLNVVSGWLPMDQLSAAASLPEVRNIRTSMMKTNVGAVTSQGDIIQRSSFLRPPSLIPGYTGAGITVGVLSDSFACRDEIKSYADDVASGDLAANIEVLEEISDCNGGADEGRGMAQIVYDVAPGSTIKFHTAFNGEADFAQGIIDLATAGATVIVDDVFYFDEPVFQDGIVAQAVDIVKGMGVSYFSSAGNQARESVEAPFGDSGLVGPPGADNEGQPYLDWNPDPSDDGVAAALPVTLPAGGDSVFFMTWDQSYITESGAAPSNSLQMCLTNTDGTSVFFCSGANGVGDDPFIFLEVTNGGPAAQVGLSVNFVGGRALPGLVKISYFDFGAGATTIDQFDTRSPTAHGHSSAAGASSVGATRFYQNPFCDAVTYPHYQLEVFSSSGGDPILFTAEGQRLATPDIRTKPNFTAPDGGYTTFFAQHFINVVSSIPGCANDSSLYNFFGTSAAAPHAAGVAALLRQAQPQATPDLVRTALETTANDDVGTRTVVPVNPTDPRVISVIPGFDNDAGFGVIVADAALPRVLPGAALSPSVLNFPATKAGDVSAAQTVTLTNTGGFVLTGISITVTAGYRVTSTCPPNGVLAADGSCVISVVFAPTSEGANPGTLEVRSDAGSSPDTVALSGRGTDRNGGGGGGAFGLWLLLSGFGAAMLRRRRKS